MPPPKARQDAGVVGHHELAIEVGIDEDRIVVGEPDAGVGTDVHALVADAVAGTLADQLLLGLRPR